MYIVPTRPPNRYPFRFGDAALQPDREVRHTCPKCRCRWAAVMYYGRGGWLYRDVEEMNCPKCKLYDGLMYPKN